MVLLREIKRRKVLHTLSLYIVGCWVALQVVEVLSEAGLPPQTMRYLLAAMSAGFPIVLIIAWFFDVSTEGITRTRPRADDTELPTLNLGDHALLAGILAVLALNAYVLSSPAPTQEMARVTAGRVLVVLPFDDAGDSENAVGDALASELRSEFKRVAGLRVLGRETSNAIKNAGEVRNEIARELGVTSLLVGDAALVNDEIQLRVRVVNIPAGNVVWQSDFSTPVGRGPDLQRRIVEAILDAVIPAASAESAIAPRVASGECESVYDLFLRGRQFWLRNERARAHELISEATRIDSQCGVAWEALAVMSIDWTKEGFTKAGAAARRALEINEALGGAWATLAEIAEEEERWRESERLFLRALYVDPTNAIVNAMYAEALLARGRVSDAVHYAREGYRYEPAFDSANWMLAMAARYAGDPLLVKRHAQIFAELRGNPERYGWDNIGAAFIMEGEIERAAQLYESKVGEYTADWFPQCVRSLADPGLREGLVAKMRESMRQYLHDELSGWQNWYVPSHIIICATSIGEVDIAIELFSSVEDIPTEAKFMMFFMADHAALRQTEHFRNLVVDSGLLDYWREWGWSDYCRPDGDSFTCD
jgi:TolB-like protein